MSSSGLAAAILEFRLPVTSDSIDVSVTGWPVPENMVVAVGIAFLYSIQAEMYVFHVYSGHLGFSTCGVFRK